MIIVIGESLCRNDLVIMMSLVQCNRPRLCVNTKYIDTLPGNVISANFHHYYPSMASVKGFLQQQIDTQGWKGQDIHLILTSVRYGKCPCCINWR